MFIIKFLLTYTQNLSSFIQVIQIILIFCRKYFLFLYICRKKYVFFVVDYYLVHFIIIVPSVLLVSSVLSVLQAIDFIPILFVLLKSNFNTWYTHTLCRLYENLSVFPIDLIMHVTFTIAAVTFRLNFLNIKSKFRF